MTDTFLTDLFIYFFAYSSLGIFLFFFSNFIILSCKQSKRKNYSMRVAAPEILGILPQQEQEAFPR